MCPPTSGLFEVFLVVNLITDISFSANTLTIFSNIGNFELDANTYIPINRADLTPKKVCSGDRFFHFLKIEAYIEVAQAQRQRAERGAIHGVFKGCCRPHFKK